MMVQCRTPRSKKGRKLLTACAKLCTKGERRLVNHWGRKGFGGGVSMFYRAR